MDSAVRKTEVRKIILFLEHWHMLGDPDFHWKQAELPMDDPEENA